MHEAAFSCFLGSGCIGKNRSASQTWCHEPSRPRQTLESAYGSGVESHSLPGPSAGPPCPLLVGGDSLSGQLVGRDILPSSLGPFLWPPTCLSSLPPPSRVCVPGSSYLVHLPLSFPWLASLGTSRVTHLASTICPVLLRPHPPETADTRVCSSFHPRIMSLPLSSP